LRRLRKKSLSLNLPLGRLGKEVEDYIKLTFYLQTSSLIDWIFPLKPSMLKVFYTKQPIPPTEVEVVICAKCGKILGECIGGGVVLSCFSCYSINFTNPLPSKVTILRAEAGPTNIDYELARVLKEIYHGRNRKLQCFSH